MRLVTVDQMRRLEARAEEAGVSTTQLMENAGLAAAAAVRDMLGGLEGRRILILVGPGNNGGDGLVAGRHLRRWGADVTHYLCAPRPDADPPAAAAQRAGIPALHASQDAGLSWLSSILRTSHVVIDAVLGTGRARPLGEPLVSVFAAVHKTRDQASQPLIVALDVPTGLDADTGVADPHTLAADLTLTLGHPKSGLFNRDGPTVTGNVRCLPIGIPAGLDTDIPREVITAGSVRAMLPRRLPHAHKGSNGKALVIAGSQNYVGAVGLAAKGAGRSGAGLVTVAAPAGLQPYVAGVMPEATHMPLPEGPVPGILDMVAMSALSSVSDYDAFLVGCGVGHHQRTVQFLRALLLQPDGLRMAPIVLDADALGCMAGVADWWASLPSPAILTPHPGEMSRLTGLSTQEVQADRLNVAEAHARKWGVVVVLKGAYTVVAAPQGQTRISPWAVPALATAGTGDVLAGVIVGLLAQGLTPFDAASGGVYLHALAGRMASTGRGNIGLLASDLFDHLPKAIDAVMTAPESLEW